MLILRRPAGDCGLYLWTATKTAFTMLSVYTSIYGPDLPGSGSGDDHRQHRPVRGLPGRSAGVTSVSGFNAVYPGHRWQHAWSR